jgi:hypothetical protein
VTAASVPRGAPLVACGVSASTGAIEKILCALQQLTALPERLAKLLVLFSKTGFGVFSGHRPPSQKGGPTSHGPPFRCPRQIRTEASRVQSR